jgi:hypothetical protein
MKYSFIILLLILNASVVSPQEVVSCNGDSKSGAGVEVSWTVGEAEIETLVSSSNVLTQGFHQTRLTVTAVSEILFPGLEIKVFPNPTPDIITIQFSEFIDGSRYWLYDMSGKVMENKLINSADTEISMKNYASGQYILKLTNKSRRVIQTFQVVKY